MLAKINTATLKGISGEIIRVETDLARGLPTFNMVGLPNRTIKESIPRINSAIVNSGYEYPQKKITVNLSPANSSKDGAHFDLPIAVGILAAKYEISSENLKNIAIFGELSLNGEVKKIRGALPLTLCAIENKFRNIIVPFDNEEEVSLATNANIYAVKNLKEVIMLIQNKINLKPVTHKKIKIVNDENKKDFSQVYGQEAGKRALCISAAGGHGIFILGSPGVGKTMLAERLITILPPLNYREQLELTNIYSIKGLLTKENSYISKRPFRMPHSTITKVGMLGGGINPIPGEFSLAHRGVLFLDEFGQFETSTLEALRKPIEEGKVEITRKSGKSIFPGKIILVCASNPCKCGYYGDDTKLCTCSESQINNYQGKFSGPILERLDLQIIVNRVPYEKIENNSECLSSKDLKILVDKARKIQYKRYISENISLNCELTEDLIDKYCIFEDNAKSLLHTAYNKFGLSMRTYIKVIKVSRTIADLDNSEKIKVNHITEALSYRRLEEKFNK